MADDVEVRFGAQYAQVVDAAGKVKQAIEGITGLASGVTNAFGHVAEAIATAFSIEKIKQFMESMEQLGLKTERTMAILGVSAKDVATLDAASQASGSSLEGLTRSLARLDLKMAEAEGGSERATAAIKSLGLTAKSLESLSDMDKLKLIADRFAQLKDGAEKTAIAMILFGRAGMQMIPFLNEGAAGFDHWKEAVERAGSEPTKEFLARAHEMHTQSVEMGMAFDGLSMTMTDTFGGALSGLQKWFLDLIENMNDAIKGSGALSALFDILALTVKGIASAFVIATGGFQIFFEIVSTGIDIIAGAVMKLGRIIKDVFTGNLFDAQMAFSSMQTDMVERLRKSAETLSKIAQQEADQLRLIWEKHAAERVKIDQNIKPKLDLNAAARGKSAMEEAQAAIRIADMTYQMQVEKINSNAKLFLITEHQKTQQLLAAVDQRLAAEMAALDKAIAGHNLSKAEYQKIEEEKTKIKLKAEMDRQKIVDHAAEEEMKKWKQVADDISGSMNSQLRGLLAGTTSWGQAMKNIMADLVVKWIGEINKLVIQWIAGQLRAAVMGKAIQATELAGHVGTEAAKTAATEVGVTARVGAEATGTATGLLTGFVDAIKFIFAQAAKTFAGIFAFLSPVMGPAAAGPAAAGEASVMAVSSMVPAAATGADYVLRSGLAMIHEGEKIVPAKMNQPYTGVGQGGGQGSLIVNFHMPTLDGASLAAFLHNGGGNQITKFVSNAMNRNPSLRPAY